MKEFRDTAKGVVALALVVGFGMIMLGQFAKQSVTISGTNSINTTLQTMYGSTGLGSYATWIGLIILLGIFVYFMSKFDKI
jgi:hypothetical protein